MGSNSLSLGKSRSLTRQEIGSAEAHTYCMDPVTVYTLSEYPQCTGQAMGSRGELEVVPNLTVYQKTQASEQMKTMRYGDWCHRESQRGSLSSMERSLTNARRSKKASKHQHDIQHVSQ